MTSNAWFVLFPKANVPTKDAVLQALSTIRDARVETTGGALAFTVIITGGSFDVGLNTHEDVVSESREAVDRAGSELDDPDAIAGYDARFELLFDGEEIGDVFNPLLAAAERLAKLTGGVIYESDNGVFQ